MPPQKKELAWEMTSRPSRISILRTFSERIENKLMAKGALTSLVGTGQFMLTVNISWNSETNEIDECTTIKVDEEVNVSDDDKEDIADIVTDKVTEVVTLETGIKDLSDLDVGGSRDVIIETSD
ncbi:hypothetical protein N8077_05180 [Myxococcota bacterium]|nr:hypothetical protein [Myxococcota bacterium]